MPALAQASGKSWRAWLTDQLGIAGKIGADQDGSSGRQFLRRPVTFGVRGRIGDETAIEARGFAFKCRTRATLAAEDEFSKTAQRLFAA